MSRTFFILGNHPDLSLAEMTAAAERQQISLGFQQRLGSAALLQTTPDLSPDFFFSLGGAIKYGSFLREVPADQFHSDVLFSLLEKFSHPFIINGKKFLFGVSVYADTADSDHRWQKKVYAAALQCKKQLRQEQIKVRFVTSREPALSSVVVHKNGLDDPERGVELVVIVAGQKVFLGITRAVQDFEQFGFFDYGRPARDSRSGMLPPKVARFMIHLSQADTDQYILDPFCGSGTIVQEALRLGYRSLVASDNSRKAMQDTEKNLHWLAQSGGVPIDFLKEFDLLKTEQASNKSASVFLHSIAVEKLQDVFPPCSIGAIVTEPYLGPPELGTGRSQVASSRLRADLEHLYLQAFRSFQHVLLPGGRVVMIWPVFFQGQNFHYLQIVAAVKKLGFSLQAFPSFIRTNSRGALEYGRKGQLVRREIWVFRKNMV